MMKYLHNCMGQRSLEHNPYQFLPCLIDAGTSCQLDVINIVGNLNVGRPDGHTFHVHCNGPRNAWVGCSNWMIIARGIDKCQA